MSNPTWPTSLPTPRADSSFALTGAQNVIRTNMETGAAKQRRRFTNATTAVACTLIVNRAQISALNAFWVNTLKDVMPFDWTDFSTGEAGTYRPTGQRPSYSFIEGSNGLFLATLAVELMP